MAKAGYCFSDDTRPHKKGNIFDRQVINAELNILLYGAGINIYAGTLEGLGNAEYIPSLTIRADLKSKTIAGTRFYGFLRIGDTAYVLYYSGRENEGIFPKYEEDTFLNLISNITSVKHIAVIITSESMEGLERNLFLDKTPHTDGGVVPFCEVMKKWNYDFYLLPMNKDGITQTKMMFNDLRRETAELFGNVNNIPIGLNNFDSVCEGKANIVAMDMNVTRVKRALMQALTAGVTPNIICLSHQASLYRRMAIYYEYPKQIKFTIVNNDKMVQQFPTLAPTEMPLESALTKEGKLLIL